MVKQKINIQQKSSSIKIKKTQIKKQKKQQKTLSEPSVKLRTLENPLSQFLDRSKGGKGYLILDGGIGSLLQQKTDLYKNNSTLWQSQALIDNHQAIFDVHYEFFNAGSDVATTATYSASEQGFLQMGIQREQSQNLMRKAVEIANNARIKTGNKGLVVASVGYAGTQKFKALCYTGDYHDISVKNIKDFHEYKLEAFQSSNCDMIAFETIPNLKETKALIPIIKQMKIKCWIAFSCNSNKTLVSGEQLSEAIKLVEGLENVVAIGVNCIKPELGIDLIKLIKKITKKPIVIYPNRGDDFNVNSREFQKGQAKVFDEEGFADLCVQFYKAGAKLIGGCCMVHPSTIQRIREKMDLYRYQ